MPHPSAGTKIELRTDLVGSRNRIWGLLMFPEFTDIPPAERVGAALDAIRSAVDPLRWRIKVVGTQAFCVAPAHEDHLLEDQEADELERLIIAHLEKAGFTVELR
jgi:hypothetical protein